MLTQRFTHKEQPLWGRTGSLRPVPSAVADKTLSPSLGTENQILIMVNQTLQIMEERRKEVEKLDERTQDVFTACWGVTSAERPFRWAGNFLGILLAKLLTFPNSRVPLSECKTRRRWELGSSPYGIIMMRSLMQEVRPSLTESLNRGPTRT